MFVKRGQIEDRVSHANLLSKWLPKVLIASSARLYFIEDPTKAFR